MLVLGNRYADTERQSERDRLGGPATLDGLDGACTSTTYTEYICSVRFR